MKKRRVVCAILSDIFPFSSLGILKISDEILKTSDEIVGKCPKFEMNEPKKTIRRREKCVLISYNEETSCDFRRSALTFRPRDFALFDTDFRVREREDDDGVEKNDNLFLIRMG